MRKNNSSAKNDDAISSVVGEMMMIALALVLVSVFSASLLDILPCERDPSLNVMMSTDDDTITLWHKGGDWVKKSDLEAIIFDGKDSNRFRSNCAYFSLSPDAQVFDLGSKITINVPGGLNGGETVRLATPHTLLFSGVVGGV